MRSKGKKISLFDAVNVSLVVLITLILLNPLYFCVIASFSDPSEVIAGNTLLWIKDFTLEAYQNIIKESELWRGYGNTIIYTIFGTIYNLVLTIPAAYVLSKKHLPFKNIISWYFFLTMFISGGMIPTYLLMKDLHLVNNPLVMIIGVGVSAYNLIVARQFFSNSIPSEIYEAAYVDGAGEFKCFTSIALPLSKPITAVLALYYGVGHWNSYYTGLLYLRDKKYFSLQQVLRSILMTNESAAAQLETSTSVETAEYLLHKMRIAQGMKYSTIFVACLPLLIVYPFIQKYFAKGAMIGGVKG